MRASRDHILPVMWGGTDNIAGARNVKVVCQECNERRAMCMHCVAIVACVGAVAEATRSEFDAIYHLWRLGVAGVVHEWRPPGIRRAMAERRREKGRLLQEAAERRKANSAAVEISRQMHRIGLDEFAYPADTAAKRVWNLATLRRTYDGPVAA